MKGKYEASHLVLVFQEYLQHKRGIFDVCSVKVGKAGQALVLAVRHCRVWMMIPAASVGETEKDEPSEDQQAETAPRGMIIDENVLQSNFKLFTCITIIALITGSVSSRRHVAGPQLVQNPVTNGFIQTTATISKIDLF